METLPEARCDITLREFRTVDGERILDSIAKEHKLTSTTLAHIKAFLSGSFRFAKRQGVINSENPVGTWSCQKANLLAKPMPVHWKRSRRC